MKPLHALPLIPLAVMLGCHKTSDHPEALKSPSKLTSSLEKDLKRFLNRNAPELNPAAAFDQEAEEGRLPVITRRNEEKKIEIPGQSPYVKDTISINGMIKSCGGQTPKSIKGVWIYLWQAMADIKASKARYAFLSLDEAEDLVKSLDFAEQMLNKNQKPEEGKITYLKSIARNFQVMASLDAPKSDQKSGTPNIGIFYYDVTLRLKPEHIHAFKQNIIAAKSWAEKQKDDFERLGLQTSKK